MFDTPARLLIADHQAAAVSGLANALASLKEIHLIGVAKTHRQLMEQASSQKPDIIVLDLNLPADVTPEQYLPMLCSSYSRVIIFTAEQRLAFLRLAAASGVAGYLLKDEPLPLVTAAIRRVQNGEQAYSGQVCGRRPQISDTENHILSLLGAGKRYSDIAAIRRTSAATVRKQCDKLRVKLELHSREDRIVWAGQNGFVSIAAPS